jgi:hypothetical protein
MTSNQPPRNQGQNPTLKALNSIQKELRNLNQTVANLETRAKKSKSFNIRDYLLQHAPLFVIALLLLVLLVNIAGLRPEPPTPPKFQYDIQSPDDLNFRGFMNAYGQTGWQIVSCRRALNALGDGDASYECILMREARNGESEEETGEVIDIPE